MMTWSLFCVPATFVRLLRASAKRRVISTMEVMAPALGEKDPGGCWDKPWVGVAVGDHEVLLVMARRPGSKRRQDLSCSHQSGTQSVGPSDVNTLGHRLILSVVGQGLGCSNSAGNGVRNLVGRIRKRGQRQGAGNGVGLSASGYGSIGVEASVGLEALVKRRRERCRDLGRSEL